MSNTANRDAIVAVARCSELPLPERPLLVPWVTAIDLGDDRLQLRSNEFAYTLTHPLLVQAFWRVEPLLDGQHELEQISQAAGPDILPTTVLFLLKLLKNKGLLQPGPDAGDGEPRALSSAQHRFLSHFVPDAANTLRVLTASRVGLTGDDAIREEIAAALSAIGIGHVVHLHDLSHGSVVQKDRDAFDLIVACGEPGETGFFEQVNRECLTTGMRWLRVAIGETFAELGPTIVPYETACYTCLDLRRQTHEPDLQGYLAFTQGAGRRRTAIRERVTRPLLTTVAGQAALEVWRVLTGFAPAVTIGRFYELQATTPMTTAHDALKVPRCPACDTRRSVSEAWDRGFSLISVDL